ncbi:hypothetical protein AALP_AA3G189100 [Arabis alpina]|uniref:Phylloplanin-like n=1 Tax=Arabis alpina TaxID=50452 RepID=A0A087HA59_ARAAL|nr:hypothetical protein AALP_AA3G189100 [Arabis alpina]
MAKAQLLGSGGLLGGLLGGGGGLGGLLGGLGLGGGGGSGGLGGLLSLANIDGVIFCTANGNLPLTGTSAPPFANAGVQLQCGRQNTVVATSTTNSVGIFSFPANLIQMVLRTLISDCRVVVTTPLATCNANLPLGSLVSQLAVVGSTINGLLNVVNVAPTGFTLTATT